MAKTTYWATAMEVPHGVSGLSEEDNPKLITPPVSPPNLAGLTADKAFGMDIGSFLSGEPFYDLDTPRPGPFLVGIAGGTASGKTTITEVIQKKLEKLLGEGTIATFSQDCFYKDLTPEQLLQVAQYNFDHPEALDWAESLKVVRELRQGGVVRVPQYDYCTNRRSPDHLATVLDGTRLRVVIVEGILLFHSREMRELLDLRIFVDVSSDERLCRRVQRDVRDRGRTIEHVLRQYQDTVKPSFEAFCEPTKKFADVIMPRGIDNPTGLQVIVGAIERAVMARLR